MKEVTCPFCNHKQKTRSKLNRITCSNCGKKFPIEKDINSLPMTDKKTDDNRVLNPEEEIKTNINKEELKRVKLD